MNLPPTPQAPPVLPAQGVGWPARWRRSTVGAWLAAVLCVVLPFIAANILTRLFLADPALRDLRNLVKVLVLVAAYAAYVRWWERRPAQELSFAGAVPETLAGLVLGGLLFAAVMGVLAAMGAYVPLATGSWGQLGEITAAMLPKIAAGALVEELVFRLLLLRLLERSFGSGWALVLSSLAFGLAHLGNAGATPLIGIMLGIELGLLFGAAYLVTRRIWLCTAMHLAWNFVQGAVFSIAVSGHGADGWLRGSLSGPAWLTGGAFGVEASIVSVLVGVMAAGVLLRAAHRRGPGLAWRPR